MCEVQVSDKFGLKVLIKRLVEIFQKTGKSINVSKENITLIKKSSKVR